MYLHIYIYTSLRYIIVYVYSQKSIICFYVIIVVMIIMIIVIAIIIVIIIIIVMILKYIYDILCLALFSLICSSPDQATGPLSPGASPSERRPAVHVALVSSDQTPQVCSVNVAWRFQRKVTTSRLKGHPP